MPDNKGRVLIQVPGNNARGGITNYYQILKPLFSLPVDFIERGARNWPVRGTFIMEFSRLIIDYFLFLKAIRTGKYSLVVTNTSFSKRAILRDGLYLLLARCYKLKTITFFRGWDYDFSEKVEKKYLRIFRYVYFSSDALIDLAQKNIDILKKWGYEKQIYLETVAVDKELVTEINEKLITTKYESENFNLLFLARLEKSKGVYETIDTFVILKDKFPALKLIVAGEGEENDNLRTYIKDTGSDNITVTGFIEGREKGDLFTKSDIYLFPSYSEGMPTSLIEAMAFGLPVVTRSVGGISDFFVNNTNGYITESKDPVVLASLVELIINNTEKVKGMALFNYKYAKEHFYSDKVISRVENILLNVLNK